MKASNINKILKQLTKNYPNPQTELNYKNPYTFLIAVVLSAQSTDVSVNKSTKDLFKIVNNPKSMIKLGEKKLIKYIKTIGLYNTKAKNIIKLSKILVKKYNCIIPKKFSELTMLPGVGNKTASVYQNTILKIPRIAVDTHVFRVSNRIGLVTTKTPDLTQKELESKVPNNYLATAHHLLILHGRRICKAQNPLCGICSIRKNCYYYNKN
tara:strand:- start:958 stop:1587 length:630 start_codon:yes stop_codon:yes gene_type:complete